MLTSQFVHQRTFADGWETNEATADISTLPSQVSTNDLHTSNTSTRNIETGWSLLSECDTLRLEIETHRHRRRHLKSESRVHAWA